MDRWYNPDGRWRLTAKVLNGQELLQLDMRGAVGWIWKGDYRSRDDITIISPAILTERRDPQEAGDD